MARLKTRFRIDDILHWRWTHPGCASARVLVVLAIVFLQSSVATSQQQLDALKSRNADLEVKKLDLEIQKLELELAELKARKSRAQDLPVWITVLFGFLGGIAATTASVWGARRARIGALDQSVHDKRLESYPRLVKTSGRLAVYFPAHQASTASVGPEDCAAMGRAMSRWYLRGGGLLLSVAARDAYFRLARALTRASLAATLKVPTFPGDAQNISVEKLDEYREELLVTVNLDDVENWTFGGISSQDDPPHSRFKDYVFLQRLSSALRTALSEDLRSRRRPW